MDKDIIKRIFMKNLHKKFINRGRMTTTQGAHASLVIILSFPHFLSWGRAFK